MSFLPFLPLVGKIAEGVGSYFNERDRMKRSRRAGDELERTGIINPGQLSGVEQGIRAGVQPFARSLAARANKAYGSGSGFAIRALNQGVNEQLVPQLANLRTNVLFRNQALRESIARLRAGL